MKKLLAVILLFGSPAFSSADWVSFPRYAVPNPGRDFLQSDINVGSGGGQEIADNFTDVVTTGKDFLNITWWGGRSFGSNSGMAFNGGNNFQLRIYRDGAASTGFPAINNGGPGAKRLVTINASTSGTQGVNRFTSQRVAYDSTNNVTLWKYDLSIDLNHPLYQNFEIDTNFENGMHWLSVVETDSSTNANDRDQAWYWMNGAGNSLDRMGRRTGAEWAGDSDYELFSQVAILPGGSTVFHSRAFEIRAVPEPGSISLLGIVLGGAVYRRRRFERKL
jgi:hypothetical protein